jgi:hypothetical protein
MTPKNIRATVAEARAFIKAAEAALKNVSKHGVIEFLDTGKESGALRRQSMNLTRSLAEMRKP